MANAKAVALKNHLGQRCHVQYQPADGQAWQYRRVTYHWSIDLILSTSKQAFAYKAGFARTHFESLENCIGYLTSDRLTEMFAEFLMQDLDSDDLLAPAGLYRDIGVIMVPAP